MPKSLLAPYTNQVNTTETKRILTRFSPLHSSSLYFLFENKYSLGEPLRTQVFEIKELPLFLRPAFPPKPVVLKDNRQRRAFATIRNLFICTGSNFAESIKSGEKFLIREPIVPHNNVGLLVGGKPTWWCGMIRIIPNRPLAFLNRLPSSTLLNHCFATIICGDPLRQHFVRCCDGYGMG